MPRIETNEVRSSPRVVVAMDKFRSSADARDVAAAIVACATPGVEFDVVALSDGGEGFRAAFGGQTVALSARGPWGAWHEVPLSIVPGESALIGIIEVAEVIGRAHHVAPTSPQALTASSAGVGDAILASVERGVTRVVVGCGGSATSDGGEGCLEVLRREGPLGVEVTAATDIGATFFGAEAYAAQKGVAPADLVVVRRRLERLAQQYERVSGREVRPVARTGAAGGLAGALYAAGANLVSGFDEVAVATSLRSRIGAADWVITGEGRLDAGSLDGKVVSGVCALTQPHQQVLVVCGSLEAGAAQELMRRYPWVHVSDLVSRFGEWRSFGDTLACVAEVVSEFFEGRR